MSRVSLRTLNLPLLMLVAYWILAFIATHLPGAAVDEMRSGLLTNLFGDFQHTDKVAHFAIYFVLSGLIMLLLDRYGKQGWLAVATTLVVAFAYGAIDEWLQSFIPRRSMDLNDWYADAFGTVCGIAAFLCLRPRFTTAKNHARAH